MYTPCMAMCVRYVLAYCMYFAWILWCLHSDRLSTNQFHSGPLSPTQLHWDVTALNSCKDECPTNRLGSYKEAHDNNTAPDKLMLMYTWRCQTRTLRCTSHALMLACNMLCLLTSQLSWTSCALSIFHVLLRCAPQCIYQCKVCWRIHVTLKKATVPLTFWLHGNPHCCFPPPMKLHSCP